MVANKMKKKTIIQCLKLKMFHLIVWWLSAVSIQNDFRFESLFFFLFFLFHTHFTQREKKIQFPNTFTHRWLPVHSWYSCYSLQYKSIWRFQSLIRSCSIFNVPVFSFFFYLFPSFHSLHTHSISHNHLENFDIRSNAFWHIDAYKQRENLKKFESHSMIHIIFVQIQISNRSNGNWFAWRIAFSIEIKSRVLFSKFWLEITAETLSFEKKKSEVAMLFRYCLCVWNARTFVYMYRTVNPINRFSSQRLWVFGWITLSIVTVNHFINDSCISVKQKASHNWNRQ